jgi:hypothetical protein
MIDAHFWPMLQLTFYLFTITLICDDYVSKNTIITQRPFLMETKQNRHIFLTHCFSANAVTAQKIKAEP